MGSRLVCWRCGKQLHRDIPRPFPRLEKCRACEADLHVCLLCRHYAPRYTSKCDHELADPAREKDLANFCHYFKPMPDAFQSSGVSAAESARSELASLFGGDEAGDDIGDQDIDVDTLENETAAKETDERAALEQLFGSDDER